MTILHHHEKFQNISEDVTTSNMHSYRNDDSSVNHLRKNEQAKSYQTNPKDTNAKVQITQDGVALLRCSKFIETPKTQLVL